MQNPALRVALAALALALAFALGRLGGRSGGDAPDPRDVASFRQALAEEDELTRLRRMSAFLEHLSPGNLAEAQAALVEKQSGVGPDEVRIFMLAWARFDAPGAFAWAQAQPAEWRPTLAREAIYAWGLRDPQGALGALEGIEDARMRDRLRSGLVSAWARSPDQAVLLAWLSELPPELGRDRDRYLSRLVAETAKGGPDAVIAWAEAIPDDASGDLKREAFRLAAGAVARADAARAAGWYEAHRDDPDSAGSLEVIARRWVAYHDPPALFEWLDSLAERGPRDAERRRALALGIRLWMEADRDAASAWLRSQTPRPALDPALAVFARETAERDPTDAFEWAELIDDESLRHRTRVAAARIWLRRDPAAAEAWLEQNDPSGELRAAVDRVAPREP